MYIRTYMPKRFITTCFKSTGQFLNTEFHVATSLALQAFMPIKHPPYSMNSSNSFELRIACRPTQNLRMYILGTFSSFSKLLVCLKQMTEGCQSEIAEDLSCRQSSSRLKYQCIIKLGRRPPTVYTEIGKRWRSG